MSVPGLWALLRRPASFRGLPFAVLENSHRRGRQVAMHVYPFRDDPWPEDLGRSPRISSFRGFVIGDDCDDQITALALAVQQPGPGQLVHPTLGSFSAQVLEFAATDTAERGRVQFFEMTIVPYVARVYPVITADTQAQTQGFFGSLGTALSSDFAAVQGTIGSVQQAVAGVTQTVQSYVGQVQGVISDATNLAHLPAALVGNFGRFAGGSRALNVPGLGGGIATVLQASSAVNGAFASASRIAGTLGALAAHL